ncbi:cell division protein FtsL [Arthrobacter sp. TE12231]
MSNAAVNSYPVAQGATARALPGLRPGQDQTRKSRTPLSVVRSSPRKRRAPFVVLCFGFLAIALMAVLVLNISVSSAQYQLVQLRSEQTTLTKQNQDLTQQVQNFDAPQNLAAKATELGMVASLAKGQIDLSTLSVTGKAKPAVKGDATGAVIAAPAVAGQLTVVPPVSDKEPLAQRKPADTKTTDGVPADTKTTDGVPAGTAQAPAAGATAPAATAPAAELHGGSVPAPAQKVPGQ